MPDEATVPTLAPVPDDLPRLLTRECLGWWYQRPVALATWLLLFLLLVCSILYLMADPGSELGIALLLYSLVVAAVPPAVHYRRVLRTMVAKFPPGSEIRLDIGAQGVTLTTPIDRCEYQWAAFRAVEGTNHAALLRRRGSNAVVVVPRQLLTSGDFERMRDAVASARS